MKEKILLIIGSSSVLSGIVGIFINSKHNKDMNAISVLFMLVGTVLSASALDKMLKPEDDEEY